MNIMVQKAVQDRKDLPKKAFIAEIFTTAVQYLCAHKAINQSNSCPHRFFPGQLAQSEVLVRLVMMEEMRSLNRQFRGKDYATNVLSFPFEAPYGLRVLFLGDIIICHQVVVAEARAQNKALPDHYAHLLLHGWLHLLGYDHIEAEAATLMEQLEIDILAKLNINNPYEEMV